MIQHAVLLLGGDDWMRVNQLRANQHSYRPPSPRPFDRELLAVLPRAHTGASALVPDPLALGGGGGVVTSSDEPQVLAVSLVCSTGLPALKGHHLVQKFPQPDLRSVEEHFIVSGRQALPPVGSADLESGDLLGDTHAPLTRDPIGVFHCTDFTTDVSHVSAVSDSPRAAAAATASPTPTLLERITPDQRDSFPRVWTRLPPHLRAVVFDLHGPEWTPLAKTK